MRRVIVGIAVLIAMAGISAGRAVAVAPSGTAGPPTGVTITPPDPDRVCAGDEATLSWTPPADTGGSPITGYFVQLYDQNLYPPQVAQETVGANVTSLDFPLRIGGMTALVWPVTAAGQGKTPGGANLFVSAPPDPVEFWNGSVTADHTVSLTMGWSPEAKVFGPGGSLADVTITLTRSDGRTFSYKPTDDLQPTVFTGLSDQKEFSWSSSATNQCGTTVGYDTPGYQTGIAPAFTRDAPPLAATVGRRYHYRFHATGKMKPTYSLLFAPEWLSIDATTGAVSGTPPVGTTTFDYGVAAINQAGEDIGLGPRGIATTDSFTVNVS